MAILHGDQPTLCDCLDRCDLVQQVGDTLMTCDPPHVFGIHGDWGAGKTSFLAQLHHYLTGENLPGCAGNGQPKLDAESDYKEWSAVIWFEAWRYQHEATPVIALLHEIRNQIPTAARWRHAGKKLSEITARSALLGLEEITKKVGLAPSKIIQEGERWERAHLAVPLPSQVIREHLQHSLEQVLGKSPKYKRPRRLIVLIDDLDRCDPETAYRLLEGMKLYLNLPNCVFVIGMDQRVVQDAIAAVAPGANTDAPGTDLPYPTRVHEYLEKLCPTIYHLPIAPRIADTLCEWLPAQRDLPALASERRDAIHTLVKLYRCLPANPRKIKAFANTLCRFLPALETHQAILAKLPVELGSTRPADWYPQESLLLSIAYLYHFHNNIYRVLEGDPTFFQLIVSWASGTEGVHPALDRLEVMTHHTGADETVPAFPDPSRGNVLRVQEMICDLPTVTNDAINAVLLK